jgi:Uma2 family endonuclease
MLVETVPIPASAVIADPALSDQIIGQRRARGIDRWDEVWEGTYIIMPFPNDEHQEIVGRLSTILDMTLGMEGLAKVRPGVNVTDRAEKWQENYRCPDVVVFLENSLAVNQDSHWLGGPDFGVEVLSSGDRSRQKLPFYAKVATRELLIVDRDPWQLELYRLAGHELALVGTATAENETILESAVIPFRFSLRAERNRPAIQVEHVPSKQEWHV